MIHTGVRDETLSNVTSTEKKSESLRLKVKGAIPHLEISCHELKQAAAGISRTAALYIVRAPRSMLAIARCQPSLDVILFESFALRTCTERHLKL